MRAGYQVRLDAVSAGINEVQRKLKGNRRNVQVSAMSSLGFIFGIMTYAGVTAYEFGTIATAIGTGLSALFIGVAIGHIREAGQD